MSKIIIALCLLALLSYSAASKGIVRGKVIMALNCGSKEESVDASDKLFKYEADEKYVSGNSVPVDYHSNQDATDNDILYTFEKKLYMYERHTYGDMTYNIQARKGKLTLILKFAQMYFTQAGQRVFNIKVGSKIIRKDFDVIEKAGQRYAAHQEYIELENKDDGVYYDGVKIPGAINNNKLKVTFSKGKADNPIVQGIILYHDSIENSPKSEFDYLRKTWDKQKELQKAMKEEEKLKEILTIQKKKEKIVIRNDQIIVQKSQPEAKAQVHREKYGFIRKVLMSPFGILLWSALLGFKLLFIYKKVFLMGSKPEKVKSD